MDEIVKEACEPPPYPGEKTKFTLSKGWSHWDKPDGDDPIQRRMMFVPTNPESPIKRFWVLGLFNGEISLRIDPTWLSDRKWQKYLKYHGIDLDTFIESLSITDAEEQKQFFTLLVQNNSFEVKDLVKIKQIIEKGSIPTTEELFGCSPCNLGGIVN